jgi:hypothetical protein
VGVGPLGSALKIQISIIREARQGMGPWRDRCVSSFRQRSIMSAAGCLGVGVRGTIGIGCPIAVRRQLNRIEQRLARLQKAAGFAD